KTGSVLIYNLYASSATAPQDEDTRISITNTNTGSSVFVHLFFVNGTDCNVSQESACLTANQTMAVFASDLDPGVTGYIIAVAVASDTGTPIDFNYLIGEADVKLASGHAARLNAVAIAALRLPLRDPGVPEMQLNFDGSMYNQVPRALALSGIPSPNDGN